MAKEVLKKFIAKRPSDRIGLVVFATQAYIASPLTLDHEFLLQNIERLELGAIDDSSTAIGSALSTGDQPLAGTEVEKQNRHPHDRWPE